MRKKKRFNPEWMFSRNVDEFLGVDVNKTQSRKEDDEGRK